MPMMMTMMMMIMMITMLARWCQKCTVFSSPLEEILNISIWMGKCLSQLNFVEVIIAHKVGDKTDIFQYSVKWLYNYLTKTLNLTVGKYSSSLKSCTSHLKCLPSSFILSLLFKFRTHKLFRCIPSVVNFACGSACTAAQWPSLC